MTPFRVTLLMESINYARIGRNGDHLNKIGIERLRISIVLKTTMMLGYQFYSASVENTHNTHCGTEEFKPHYATSCPFD